MDQSPVDQIIEHIIRVEGGYVDHPHDRGGPTKYGITEAVAREYGYTGDMRLLPVSVARGIYRRIYFIEPKLDHIEKRSITLAAELTDTGVNMGTEWPIRFLQTALTVFNQSGRLYPDLTVDGRIGPVTLNALDLFLEARGQEGEQVLVATVDHLQAARYIELALAREKNESFVYGWIKERTRI